ncbi:DNA helicase II [Bacillus subtilis]|nr:DNA helicase II [Bacillus subtilis]
MGYPVFRTGIKTPYKQPIADSLSVIGCLVSFEYGILL